MSRQHVMQVTLGLGMGGLERVIVTLCKYLDRSRFDLSVLCLRDSDGPLAEELQAMGVPVLGIGGVPDRADYLAFVRIAGVIRNNGVRVLHTHNTASLLDAWLASRIAPVRRMIHTDHARDFPDRLRYMVAEHLISHSLDHVVGVSDHTTANLMRYERIPARKLRTIPNGIDPEPYLGVVDVQQTRRDLGIGPGDPVIGVTARLTEQKGIAYLIRAFSRVKRSHPRARLLIAGEGPLEGELRATARDLGLASDVRFLGLRLDVPALLRVFDVYALPSVWEGLPMALLEAMAAGCPIVAADVGGVSTAVRHGVSGSLVKPADPERLADELVRVLSSPRLRRDYATAGRKVFRENFSGEVMAARYAALYAPDRPLPLARTLTTHPARRG